MPDQSTHQACEGSRWLLCRQKRSLQQPRRRLGEVSCNLSEKPGLRAPPFVSLLTSPTKSLVLVKSRKCSQPCCRWAQSEEPYLTDHLQAHLLFVRKSSLGMDSLAFSLSATPPPLYKQPEFRGCTNGHLTPCVGYVSSRDVLLR
jgi:hypothetical protein